MNQIEKLFNKLPIKSLESELADVLVDNCAYLVPAAPVEDKIAFFALCNSGLSFLAAGTGHFNPTYKTDQKDGMNIYYSHLAKYEFCFVLPSDIAPQVNAMAREAFNKKHPGVMITQSPVVNGKVNQKTF
jgi:hypothetical protein